LRLAKTSCSFHVIRHRRSMMHPREDRQSVPRSPHPPTRFRPWNPFFFIIHCEHAIMIFVRHSVLFCCSSMSVVYQGPTWPVDASYGRGSSRLLPSSPSSAPPVRVSTCTPLRPYLSLIHATCNSLLPTAVPCWCLPCPCLRVEATTRTCLFAAVAGCKKQKNSWREEVGTRRDAKPATYVRTKKEATYVPKQIHLPCMQVMMPWWCHAYAISETFSFF
jgi:hypothetical protein